MCVCQDLVTGHANFMCSKVLFGGFEHWGTQSGPCKPNYLKLLFENPSLFSQVKEINQVSFSEIELCFCYWYGPKFKITCWKKWLILCIIFLSLSYFKVIFFGTCQIYGSHFAFANIWESLCLICFPPTYRIFVSHKWWSSHISQMDL